MSDTRHKCLLGKWHIPFTLPRIKLFTSINSKHFKPQEFDEGFGNPSEKVPSEVPSTNILIQKVRDTVDAGDMTKDE